MKILLALWLILSASLFAAEEDRYGSVAAGQRAADRFFSDLKRKLDEDEANVNKKQEAAYGEVENWNRNIQEAERMVQALLPNVTMMEQVVKGADEEIAIAEKALADLNALGNSEALRRTVTTLTEEVNGLRTARADVTKGLDEARRRHAAAQEAVAAAQEKRRQAEEAVSQTYKDLADFQARKAKEQPSSPEVQQQAEEARLAAERAQMGAIKALRSEIRGMTLGQKLSDLSNKVQDAKMKEMVMEEMLNEAATGLFLKKKMVGLLMDQEFCKAAKECPNYKPNLDRLFSTTERDREKSNKSH